MSDLVEEVLRLREAGMVERCHVLPHHGEYSIAQHVYGMLVLLQVLHPDPPARLYRAILLHDAHERIIGDIPGSFREAVSAAAPLISGLKVELDRRLGYDVALTDGEREWLKAVDRLEFLMWCHDQIALGNRHVEGRLESVRVELAESSLPEPCAEFFCAYKWRRSRDRIS